MSRTALILALVAAPLALLLSNRDGFETLRGAGVAYVINLEKHKERLTSFTTSFAASDVRMPLNRVAAIDGSLANWDAVATPRAVAELRDVVATGTRRRHDQLTPGAVGCYLSHMDVWKRLVDSGRDWAVVFEDDARIPADLARRASEALRGAPDFDVLLLGWEGDVDPFSNDLVRVRRFCRTHAYVITREAARRLLESMLPMEQQLDWAMSARIALGLRVFATTRQIVDIEPDFGTSIQMPLR